MDCYSLIIWKCVFLLFGMCSSVIWNVSTFGFHVTKLAHDFWERPYIIYIYIYFFAYIFAYICLYIRIYMHIYSHINAYIEIHMHTYKYIYRYIHIHDLYIYWTGEVYSCADCYLYSMCDFVAMLSSSSDVISIVIIVELILRTYVHDTVACWSWQFDTTDKATHGGWGGCINLWKAPLCINTVVPDFSVYLCIPTKVILTEQVSWSEKQSNKKKTVCSLTISLQTTAFTEDRRYFILRRKHGTHIWIYIIGMYIYPYVNITKE